MLSTRSWRGATFVLIGGLITVMTVLSPVKQARGFVSNATIVPTWNTTSVLDQEVVLPSCQRNSTYLCETEPSSTLFTLSETSSYACDDVETARIAMKFDLSSIPAAATITSVQLRVVVNTRTDESQTVRRASSDNPDTLSCTTANLYSTLTGPGTSFYANFTNWITKGLNTLDLGVNAVADIQSRLNGSKTIALSISSNGDQYGSIYSLSASSNNQPKLFIAYTLKPSAPTDFAHTTVTTESITWSWLDRAQSDTDNVVHDQAHNLICSAGMIPGIGGAASCTENRLLPNTQYTRHPNAIDPEGSTDGSPDAAYTAIETPTGVSINSLEKTKIIVAATGHISNLPNGFSGVNFTETGTNQTSGWIQSNAWTISALRPNTQYTFQAQARNGDGLVTPLSGTVSRYTLAADANVTSARTVNTWYTTPDFLFANAAGWGSGGVQYYRYTWNTQPVHAFTGTESTWSGTDAACPGGTCTVRGDDLQLTTNSDSAWYLHVLPYNSDNISGTDATYGPYFFDATPPPAPLLPLSLRSASSRRFTQDLTALSIDWQPTADATSGLHEYQIAIGTTLGGTDVRGFASVGQATHAVVSGLRLQNGTTYYFSIRAVDAAGNASGATSSNGILANTQPPRILDRQGGDATHRPTGGTRYNVDFVKASTGPLLLSAEYAVYSKPKLGGKLVKGWTSIFNDPRVALTDNWTVSFAALRKGTNYVSVRTVAQDGLVSQKTDAFTIVKDTSPAPRISGILFSTFPQTSGPIDLLVLGTGFKPGVRVWVGTQPASSVRITRRGTLEVTVQGAKLKLGGNDLRVVNPNGRQAIRRNKVIILP